MLRPHPRRTLRTRPTPTGRTRRVQIEAARVIQAGTHAVPPLVADVTPVRCSAFPGADRAPIKLLTRRGCIIKIV